MTQFLTAITSLNELYKTMLKIINPKKYLDYLVGARHAHCCQLKFLAPGTRISGIGAGSVGLRLIRKDLGTKPPLQTR